jgi:hypothetical protein
VEDVPGKNMRPRRWGARAPVLIGVIAPATTWVVTVVGLPSPFHASMSMGVQDDPSVTDGADTLMYRGYAGGPRIMWHLVDKRVPSIPLGGCMLAGDGPAPS